MKCDGFQWNDASALVKPLYFCAMACLLAGCSTQQVGDEEPKPNLRLVASWCGPGPKGLHDATLVLSLVNETRRPVSVDEGIFSGSSLLIHFLDRNGKDLATEPSDWFLRPRRDDIISLQPGQSLTDVFYPENILGARLTNDPYRVVFEYNTDDGAYEFLGARHPYPASWNVERIRLRSNELVLKNN